MLQAQEQRQLNQTGRRTAPEHVRIYRKLRVEGTTRAVNDPFTAHVFACVLTIGLCEAAENGCSVAETIGLNREQLRRLISAWAPAARRLINLDREPESAPCDDEETQIRALLEQYRSDAAQETEWLIAIIARRAMQPRHLWQDLGLLDRSELSRLMTARFASLSARNVANMRWKKFFFRCLCENEGFTLCAAPSCQECSDFEDCFGDETGESQLARLRRAMAPGHS